MPLSLTFSAGRKLLASTLQSIADAIDDAQETLWVLTSTTGTTAVANTETVPSGLSAPSSVYLAHTAYRLRFRFIYKSNTGSATMTVNVRDTNAAGTLRMSNMIFNATTANSTPPVYFEHVIANTTGSNITRVLAVTHTSSSAVNTVQFNAASTLSWLVECQAIGLDTEYPDAVAL